MKINPDDPATGWAASNYTNYNQGLTIRTHIATMAMQGLLANPNNQIVDHIINTSVLFADALIKKLNETSNEG
jgi:hypothetical protein